MRIEYCNLDAKKIDFYFNKLTEYYYSNSIECSAVLNFSLEMAQNKICEMKHYINDDKAIVYGAFIGNEIIGYIWAYKHQFRDEMRMYVSEIYVEKRFRSRGVGRKLLNLIEDNARVQKLESIYIHVEAWNSGAWRLYEKEGYTLERVQLCKRLV